MECKPPAPTKPSRKTKGKGGERPPDDVGLEVTSEARWESVRKILDSNRCLVLEAGKGLYLKASGIFEFDELEREGNIPTICDEELVGISHGGLSESGKGDNGVIFKDFDGVGGRGFVGKNSPCTVCLDFYLQLNLREALSERDGSMKAKEAAPCNAKVKQERYITLLTCSSKGLEISATVEPWAQPDGYAAAVDDTQAGISERDAGNYAEFGHRNANVRPPTDHSQVSVSERSSSAKHRHGPGDPVDSATWYVSAISVRSGSCTTLAPCASPTVNHGRRNEHDTERVEVAPPDKVTIELAAWHSLAVGVSENNDVPVLFIDGKVLPLRRSQRGLVEGGPGEMELTSDGVFLGGTDGAWSTLAVKNLAVYEKALDDERLAEITHVYSTWRREREVAAHADAQEDRKRLEEAKEAGIVAGCSVWHRPPKNANLIWGCRKAGGAGDPRDLMSARRCRFWSLCENEPRICTKFVPNWNFTQTPRGAMLQFVFRIKISPSSRQSTWCRSGCLKSKSLLTRVRALSITKN